MNINDALTKTIVCRYCNENMERMKIKSFSNVLSVGLIAGGAFCTFLFVGPILGVPMLISGIYMTAAEKTINYCPSCGHYYKTLDPEIIN